MLYYNMLGIKTVALLVLLTYSLIGIGSSSTTGEGGEHTFMKTVPLPDNQFCRVHTFKAASRIECAGECLIKEDFGSCTALTFDVDQQVCSCGRAMCSETTLGFDDVTPTDVLVNSRCDRLKDGKIILC